MAMYPQRNELIIDGLDKDHVPREVKDDAQGVEGTGSALFQTCGV